MQRVVEYRDIAKAFQGEDGQMVVITDEDIATLPEERSHEIEVLEFVPASEIDPLDVRPQLLLGWTANHRNPMCCFAKTSRRDRTASHFALRNRPGWR